MTDPNATYKQAFADLTVKLGRIPTPRDSEWLILHREYSAAWSKLPNEIALEESRLEHVRKSFLENAYREMDKASAAGSNKKGFSRKLAPQAGALGADSTRARLGGDGGATGGAGISAESDPDRTTADGASGPPRIDERAMAAGTRVRAPRVYEGRAGRGPNGGVMAVCEQCGQEWERPLRRGRPAYRCLECREGS